MEGELLQVHQRDPQRHRGRDRALRPDLHRRGQRHRAPAAATSWRWPATRSCWSTTTPRPSSLPEVPLLGVLPGTGGLTRVVDKRRVRRDLADVFATRPEGVQGQTAVQWRLVDELAPRRGFARGRRGSAPRAGRARARPAGRRRRRADAAAARGHRRRHRLPPRRVELDRATGTARITVLGPDGRPGRRRELHAQGAAAGSLALTRELDDAILRLRTNELDARHLAAADRRATPTTWSALRAGFLLDQPGRLAGQRDRRSTASGR